MTRGEWRTLGVGLAFISPWIVGLLAFTVFPVVMSMYYSVCDYDVFTRPVWVGALNYADIGSDDIFWQAMRNTAYFAAVSLPLCLVVSLFLAVLLNNKVWFRPAFRTFFYVPSLVPMIAVAMIWLWIFNGGYGLLNYGLSLLHIKGPDWLADQHWTKPAIVLTSIWGVGGSMVIYLAALQDVSRELYESAEIDGATPWHKLQHITLPMISPVIYFNLIMGIIGSLQVFGVPYILFGNGSGPNRSAMFYATYIYEKAFRDNEMGYASAMALILFLIILALTWVATSASRRHIYYAGE